MCCCRLCAFWHLDDARYCTYPCEVFLVQNSSGEGPLIKILNLLFVVVGVRRFFPLWGRALENRPSRDPDSLKIALRAERLSGTAEQRPLYFLSDVASQDSSQVIPASTPFSTSSRMNWISSASFFGSWSLRDAKIFRTISICASLPCFFQLQAWNGWMLSARGSRFDLLFSAFRIS